MRRYKEISAGLKKYAIVKGFVNKPIHLFLYKPDQWEDDLSPKTCPYVKTMNSRYWDLDSSYTDYLYLRDRLAEPIAKDFKDKTAAQIRSGLFSEMANYCDTIFAE